MPRLQGMNELKTERQRILNYQQQFATTVLICGGTGCQATRSPAVIEALKKQLQSQGLAEQVLVRTTGCHGFCEQGPIMVLEPEGLLYCRLSPEDCRDIVAQTIKKGVILERLLYTDPVSGQKIQKEAEIPFYRAQDRTLLSFNRLVDPRSIEDYIAMGGYTALSQILSGMAPQKVLDEVVASGLRGRGGGGFPTGRKWLECREAPGEEKYVVCNADEGDPGAYMDRCVLEGNPHRVLEGMIIGAWAVGAGRGYIYVRKEYPLAVQHAKLAVQQAREYGFLGDNILGSSFSFDVEVARGGGAFVCGESTALMASLEGKVGEPRPKDIHTVKQGLWNKPTVLNNVETWANIPSIISNGSSWFSSKGTAGSKGTKILALTGQVKNTGLVEVAMGTSLRKVIFEIGGGSNNGSRSRRSRPAALRGGVCRWSCSICRWISRPSPRPVPWSVREGWWSWMPGPAWWMWPSIS